RDRLPPGVQGAGPALPHGASRAAQRLRAHRPRGWPADGRAGGGAALAGGPGAGSGGGDRGGLPHADAGGPAVARRIRARAGERWIPPALAAPRGPVTAAAVAAPCADAPAAPA